MSPFAYADGRGSSLSKIASVGSSIPKPKTFLAMHSAQEMLQFVITVSVEPAAKGACLCYKNYMNAFLSRATQEFRRTFGISEAETSPAEKDVFLEELQVEVTVFVLVPEYHLVMVRSHDGHQYSLTQHTRGVNLADLHEGQKLLCTVTRRLPRVLTARVLA